ncbi:ribonuclease H-like domain-containing protein [Tanacetum coccineum]
MRSCHSCKTSVDAESKLGVDGTPVYDLTLYRSLVGALQYLTFTRLDLSYGVQQYTLSHSSTKAEYRGVANAVVETSWLHNIFQELHSPLHSATVVYCDNVSAVYLSSNRMQHQHMKHIEIDIHFVQGQVAIGQVHVLHVPLRYQFVDIFTKGLPSALFDEFWTSLSVLRPLTRTARGC